METSVKYLLRSRRSHGVYHKVAFMPTKLGGACACETQKFFGDTHVVHNVLVAMHKTCGGDTQMFSAAQQGMRIDL